jgi:hypothetical protein
MPSSRMKTSSVLSSKFYGGKVREDDGIEREGRVITFPSPQDWTWKVRLAAPKVSGLGVKNPITIDVIVT